jgi:hypothetical protein
MIFVFSYQREEMLRQVLTDISGQDFVVLDDGSDFECENMIKFKHEGKQGFWKKWVKAFEIAKQSKDDLFIFMPSDFLNINLERIKEIHSKMNGAYVYNIINDGRDWCWVEKQPIPHDENTDRVFFTDCGFFCNSRALECINWRVREVSPKRFILRDNISSGVGQNFTMQFNTARVPIYRPKKSLAYHGDHESVMHEEHRKQKPLISK